MATLRHYSRAARNLTPQDEADVVGLFWMLGLAEATNYADVIIDTDQLREPEARSLPEIIAQQTYVDLDFSDIRLGAYNEAPFEISDEMKGIMHRATQIVDPRWAALKDFPLSKNTSVYIMDALS